MKPLLTKQQAAAISRYLARVVGVANWLGLGRK